MYQLFLSSLYGEPTTTYPSKGNVARCVGYLVKHNNNNNTKVVRFDPDKIYNIVP